MRWQPSPAQFKWFERTLAGHFALHFSERATHARKAARLRFLPFDRISETTDGLILPTDVAPQFGSGPILVDFAKTKIGLAQMMPQPSGRSWRALSLDGVPLWWLNRAGGLVPGWNLYGICASLLLALEELGTGERDAHGRFPLEHSVRFANGMLERPTVNEAFALIAAALCAVHEGHERWFDMDGIALPPLLFLSHDCDNLSGNAFWLQASRISRLLASATRQRRPDWQQLKWMLKGVRKPQLGFADEVTAYMAAEEEYGFFSRFYFLNGMKGRFGARLSTAKTATIAKQVLAPHELGLHYNYDTWRDARAFGRQLHALADKVDTTFQSGRAHYFRLDPAVSPLVWEANGIRFDESFGSGDMPAYRLGLAGVFPWFDLRSDRTLDLLECPLIFMDSAIPQRWPDDPLGGFLTFVRHVATIGGSISVLFHPGQLHNSEFQKDTSFYPRMLHEMRSFGARQMTTQQLVAQLGPPQSPLNAAT